MLLHAPGLCAGLRAEAPEEVGANDAANRAAGILRQHQAAQRDAGRRLSGGQKYGRAQRNVRRVELIILLPPHVLLTRSESLLVTEQYKDRLWDVVDEIDRTSGLKPPSQAEMNYIRKLRSRSTEAQKPTQGVLPNRESHD